MKTKYLELIYKKKKLYKVIVISIIICAIGFILYQIGVVIYILLKIIFS